MGGKSWRKGGRERERGKRLKKRGRYIEREGGRGRGREIMSKDGET